MVSYKRCSELVASGHTQARLCPRPLLSAISIRSSPAVVMLRTLWLVTQMPIYKKARVSAETLSQNQTVCVRHAMARPEGLWRQN